jgi:hypothetical protein
MFRSLMLYTLCHRLCKGFDEKPKKLGDPVLMAVGARGVERINARIKYEQ